MTWGRRVRLHGEEGWISGTVFYQSDSALRAVMDGTMTRDRISFYDRSRWICASIEQLFDAAGEGWTLWLTHADAPLFRRHGDELALSDKAHAAIKENCGDLAFVDPWTELGLGRIVRAAANYASVHGVRGFSAYSNFG